MNLFNRYKEENTMFKKEDGFTLVEMLIVLLIITVLILLIIPNLTSRGSHIHDKGCDALVMAVQAQVNAYQLEEGELPENLDTLVSNNYISNDQKTCENKKQLNYNKTTGIVSVPGKNED